ncbi:MAG: protein kinase [Myxococcota bacterium]
MEGPSRYRIGRAIKRGGMSEVHEAIVVGAQGFERKVAIKRLLPTLVDDESAVRAFIDEAQILSRLHHANIISVLDFGVFDGTPFQAMELIEGTDLADLERSAGAGLGPGLIAHVVSEVASALDYAHQASQEGEPLGIVHRDVSPENILVSWNGEVKLADFGVAFARERLEETVAGFAKGKPAFMAPEQLRGEALDGRADLFALGCVLHQLLTGKSPITRGSSPGINDQVQVELSLDPDLRTIVERAVAPDPRDRYPSAQAMGTDLGRAVHRRVPGDARAALRERLAKLRAELSPSRRPHIDDLFNVELLLEPAKSEIRRFRSVIHQPSAEAAEATDGSTEGSSDAADPDEASEELEPGALLHAYRLEGVIGRGTSGVVYRAQHTMLPRRVAIKVLKKAGPTTRRRLEREVAALIAIRSPHVVELYDLGLTPSGLPFLVMELVPGLSLKELIVRDAPIDLSRAVSWAAQITEGLEAVHAAGWVHRDLKPANVAVVAEGEVETLKLLDFGLLRGAESTRMTSLNALIGTPAFVAPEQILNPTAVTPATDLYSLGVLLHGALTAKPLFKGSLNEVLDQHLNRAPPPLTGAAAPLNALVTRMLSKDPRTRPSAREARLELLAMLRVRGDDATAISKPRGPSGTAILENSRPLVPVDPASRRAPSVPRTPPKPAVPRLALGLGLLFAAALLTTWALTKATTPELVPIAAPSPTAAPVALVVAPAKPPVVEALPSEAPRTATLAADPSEDIPEPPAIRRGARRPSRSPEPSADPAAEAKARVQHALSIRGLRAADLEGETERLYSEWSHASGQSAVRLATALEARIQAQPIDAALVEKKLAVIKKKLSAAVEKRMPTVDALETRYLALRAKAGPHLSSAQAEALFREAQSLERALEQGS